MKKLRLTSFVLAFVMVVALMVPALSIMIAAAGETITLPSGALMTTWNYSYNDALGGIDVPTKGYTKDKAGNDVVTGKDGQYAYVSGQWTNINANAYWAGKAFNKVAMTYTGTNISGISWRANNANSNAANPSNYYSTENLAVSYTEGNATYGLAGFMFEYDATNSKENTAVTFAIRVDGTVYHPVINSSTFWRAPWYFSTDGGESWTMFSRGQYTYHDGDPLKQENAARVPAKTAGIVFIPYTSFYSEGGGNTTAGVPATQLTLTEMQGKVVEAATGACWGSKNDASKTITTNTNNASLVYVEMTETSIPTAAKPQSAPETLPPASTTEWLDHSGAGWNNYYYPTGLPLNGDLVGKDYKLSSNLMVTPSTVLNADSATTVATVNGTADRSVVGLMLKVKTGTEKSGNNNGFVFGFSSGATKYAVASNHGTAEDYSVQGTYLYDRTTFGGEWAFYRDIGTKFDEKTGAVTAHGEGSRVAARTPAGYDGWIFVPLEEIRTLIAPTTDPYYSQQVRYAPSSTLIADLTMVGIDEIYAASTWGSTQTLEGVYYVYMDGYDATANVLPGNTISFFDGITYPTYNGREGYDTNGVDWEAKGAVGVEKNTMIPLGIVGASFEQVSLGTGVLETDSSAFTSIEDDANTPDVNEKNYGKYAGWSNMTTYTVPAGSNFADLDGFMLNVAVNGNSSNNALIVMIVVDGVPYFNLDKDNYTKDTYTGHETFFRWYGTNKWMATSGRHFTQGGKAVYGYDRALRLPANFRGDVFIPVEHFTQEYKAIQKYDSSGSGTNARLTREILTAAAAAGKEITIYAGQIWSQKHVTFKQASLVYANTTSTTAPTKLPTMQSVMAISNLRYDNGFSSLSASAVDNSRWSNVATFPESLWGKSFDAVKVSSGPATHKSGFASVTDGVDMKALLSNKDIRDFAGVLVEVDFSHGTSTVFNQGLELEIVGADGVTYFHTTDDTKYAFTYNGSDSWIAEGFGYRARIATGYKGYMYFPVSLFRSESATVAGMSYATFMMEQLNGLYLAAQENGSASITSVLVGHPDGWDPTIDSAVKSVSLMFVSDMDENLEELRSPDNFPVNSQTYLYENAKEMARVDGKIGPYTGLGTVANPVTDYVPAVEDAQGNVTTPASGYNRDTHTKDLIAAFEGKKITYLPLISQSDILAQGLSGHTQSKADTRNVLNVFANYGVGYTCAEEYISGVRTIYYPQLNFAVPAANKYMTSIGAAGLLIRVDTNGDHGQGTGIDVGIKLGNGAEYRMFTSGRNGAPMTNKTAYLYDYLTGTWMAQIDTSKQRLPSGFDGYVFIPFSTLGTKSGSNEVMLNMEDLYKYGISTVQVDGYWGRDLIVRSIEIAAYENNDSAVNAAPILGDDITVAFRATGFNPYGLDYTYEVDFLEKDTATLTPDANGVATYIGLKAQNMTDVMKVTVKVGNTTVVDTDFSIKAYADKLLASSTNDAEKALVNAMLQYGAAVQTAMNYKTEDLPTALKDFSGVTPTTSKEMSGSATVGAELSTEINLTLSNVSGTISATLTDAQGNTRVLGVTDPVNGKVKLVGIGANELDNLITVTVVGQSGTVVKKLTVNHYLAALVASNATDANKTIAKALYEYGVAAAAYKAASYAN